MRPKFMSTSYSRLFFMSERLSNKNYVDTFKRVESVGQTKL